MAMNIAINLTVKDDGSVIIGKVAKGLEEAGEKAEKAKAKVGGFTEAIVTGLGVGIGERIFETLSHGFESIGEAIIGLAEHGSVVESLSTSFDLLTESVGLSSQAMLEAGRTGAQGLISDVDLMRAANKALLLDLPLTTQGFKDLSAASVVLGNAVDKGPKEVFELLTQAMATGQDRALKQIGIDIDLAQVTTRYEQALGKAAGTLTETEKKAAIYQATMKAVNERSQELGGVTLGLGERLGQLRVAWDNALDSVARAIASSPALKTALGAVVEVVQELSTWVMSNEDTIRSWVDSAVLFAVDALDLLLKGVDLTVDAFNVLSPIVGAVGEFFTLLADAISTLTGGLIDFNAALGNMNLGMDAAKLAMTSLEFVAVSLNLAYQKLDLAIRTIAGHEDENTIAIRKNIRELELMKTGLSDEANAIVDGTAKKNDAGGATEALRQKLDALRTKIHDAIAAHDKHGEALKAHRKHTDDSTVATAKLTEAEKSLIKAMEGFFNEAAKLREARETFTSLSESAEDLSFKMGMAAQEVEQFGGVTQLSDRQLLDLVKSLQTMQESGGDNAWGIETLSAALAEGMGRAGTASTILQSLNADLIKIQNDSADVTMVWAEMFAAANGLSTDAVQAMLGWPPAIDSSKKSAIDFGAALQSLDAAFKVLGISADSAIGQIMGGLVGGAAAIQDFGKSITSIKVGLASGDWKAAAGGIVSGIAAGIQAAQAAIQIGKAVFDLFTQSPAEKAAKEAGKELGFKVSEEMGQAIVDQAKKLGISVSQAILLHLDEAITTTGRSAATFADQISRLMQGVHDGTIPAKEGLEELGKVFGKVREEAEATGAVGDRMTVLMLKQAQATGTLTKEMKAYLASLAQLAAEGSKQIAEGMSQIGATVGGMSDQWGQDSALFFAFGFQKAIEQQGVLGAIDSMGAQLDEFFKKMEESGNTGAIALLAPFKALSDALGDKGDLRGAVTTLEGMDKVFRSMVESGDITTQGFEAMQRSVQGTFNALSEGGVTGTAALQAIFPSLRDLVSASEQYGFALDSNTQALVDQAKAAGFAFPPEPQQVMIDLLSEIVRIMGGTLPESAQRTGDAFRSIGQEGQAAAGRTADAWNATSGQISQTAFRLESDFNTAWDGVVDDSMRATTTIQDAIDSLDGQTIGIQIEYHDPGLPGGGGGDEAAPADDGGDTGGKKKKPKHAMGSIIQPRPGGVDWTSSEAGRAELAAPVSSLYNDLSDKITSAVVRALRASGGAGGGQQQPLIVKVDINGRELARALKGQSYGVLQLNKNSVIPY